MDAWVLELSEEVIAVSYGAVQTMDLKSRDRCKESIAMEHFMRRLPSATGMIKNGRAPVLLRRRQDSGVAGTCSSSCTSTPLHPAKFTVPLLHIGALFRIGHTISFQVFVEPWCITPRDIANSSSHSESLIQWNHSIIPPSILLHRHNPTTDHDDDCLTFPHPILPLQVKSTS